MATLARHDSRQFSWLWVSHISPKNSKWLQENLSGEFFAVFSSCLPKIIFPNLFTTKVKAKLAACQCAFLTYLSLIIEFGTTFLIQCSCCESLHVFPSSPSTVFSVLVFDKFFFAHMVCESGNNAVFSQSDSTCKVNTRFQTAVHICVKSFHLM